MGAYELVCRDARRRPLTGWEKKIKEMGDHGYVIAGRVQTLPDGFMVVGPAWEHMQQYAWPPDAAKHLDAVKHIAARHFKGGILHREVGLEVKAAGYAGWGFKKESASGYSVEVNHYVVFVRKGA